MNESEARASSVLLDVGERIARLRATQGLTLEDVAGSARIDAERLAGAEVGEFALDDAELRRLADTFNVDLTALFGGRVTPFSYLAGA
jgi:transcriptional regulator with XRE-family HTH domain